MSLMIGFWNCASGLVRKTSYIHDLISSKKFDALFIAEAEISESSNVAFLIPNGYEIFFAPTLISRLKCRIICLA